VYENMGSDDDSECVVNMNMIDCEVRMMTMTSDEYDEI